MKIVIDEQKCIANNLSIEEALLAFLAKKDLNKIVLSLLEKKILSKEDKKLFLSENSINKVKDICSMETADITEEERLMSLAIQMRECFPAGKMHGTAYYYRCNNREVILKMKKFFNIYGDYPDEDIIDACRRFVASYNGNTRFLPLIKYFIFKNKTVMDEDGTNHIQEVSELASYLENKGEETTVENTDDWLMSSRN